MAKTYRDLDVYKISFDLFIRTHRFTLNFLSMKPMNWEAN